MTKYPQLPKLSYSTWGVGFYSEHWLTEVNCWMYGIIKLVEENLDLNSDPSILSEFEMLCASDHMFVYDDPKQQALAKRIFIEQYHTASSKITFEKREVTATFPIDPYKSFFVFTSLNDHHNNVEFTITKLSSVPGSRENKIILDAHHVKNAGVNIYYQYFMLQPGKEYLFEVSDSDSKTTFVTPGFGMPLYIGKEFSIKPKYDQEKMRKNLEKIWGSGENIPITTESAINSTPIHTKDELEKVLGGKRVAIYKYNKEFYSLARFQNLLPFHIECVFDDIVSLEDSSEYTQSHSTSIPVINDINTIEQRNFDAVILTSALNFETEIPFCEKLLETAIERNIPVVSLYDDALHYEIFAKRKPKENNFYIIGLDKHHTVSGITNNTKDQLDNILAVFGTDSVQGKFTTQLYLREALKSHIRIAHWATEPTGPLLGADKGYSRTYGDLTESDRVAYERQALKDLANENDIVITGGQNSIIFAPPGKHKENNASTDIFARFLPKAIVLTVSVDTSPTLVQKSLDYVEELAKKHGITSHVIALAMMDGRKIHGSRWTDTYFLSVDPDAVAVSKASFQDTFGIPVFVVPDELNDFTEALLQVDFLNA